MNLIFDIEANSLDPTKIWVMSFRDLKDGAIISITDTNEMKNILTSAKTLIGHNIIQWDVPALEKVLDIKINARLVDTLPLSWYLYSENKRHGLEYWGGFFGIPKPNVEDFDDPQLLPVYQQRCETDVSINFNLWKKIWSDLLEIFEVREDALRFLDYLMAKMSDVAMAESCGWQVDIPYCRSLIEELTALKEAKIEELKQAMPKIPIKVTMTKPNPLYKKSGGFTNKAQEWFYFLEKNNLPTDYEGQIEVIKGYKDANPDSSVQIKKWLFDNGWKPATFKYKKEADGSVKKIEQINLPNGEGVCKSILELSERLPAVLALSGLSILTHRLGLLNAFLANSDENGRIKAQISGITNTLRFRHSGAFTNLPKVSMDYGYQIRKCLIADEGFELCGADMVSLENLTRNHYIYPLDPDYVKNMSDPDYDSHTDLAVIAGLMTEDEERFYKYYDKKIKLKK